MEKKVLQNIIYKYHLEGIIEIAQWNINNNNVKIPFLSTNKDMFGKIEAPFENENDVEFVTYGTSKLLKLLSVTDDDIKVKLNTQYSITNKMIISDSQYEIEYTLADMMLAPSLPKSMNEPDYEITFDLNQDLANKFIKAKKSVEAENVLITPTQNQTIKFIIGEVGDYNDKIHFEYPAKYDTLAIKTLSFPVEYIKNIFINNKCEGKGYLSTEGLLKLEFEENNIKSEYLIIAK